MKEKKKIIFVLVLIDSLTNAGGLRDEGQIQLIVLNRARNKNQWNVTLKKPKTSFGGCFFPGHHVAFSGLFVHFRNGSEEIAFKYNC